MVFHASTGSAGFLVVRVAKNQYCDLFQPSWHMGGGPILAEEKKGSITWLGKFCREAELEDGRAMRIGRQGRKIDKGIFAKSNGRV
jgi:hypothetical protein